MSKTHLSTEDYDEPGLYEIRIKGHLDDRWAAWFEGLTLTRESNGDTLMSGTIVDQAALFGLLRKVRDMGVLLISVTLVGTDPLDADTRRAYSGDDPPGSERRLPSTDP